MSNSADDPALLLVEQALAALERDGRVDLPAICRERPDLLPLVEAAVACSSGALQIGGAPPAENGDKLLGTRLGDRYELRRRLGAGAMGAVYEAQDTVLGRAVAAKVLHRALFGDDAQARERFRREARAAAALHHPGIVAVHDHGTGELPYLIMDLVLAPDLGTVLAHLANDGVRDDAGRAVYRHFFAASGATPWARPWPRVAAALLASASRAVAVAHAHGVVHRDLKPSNLLVRADGSLVVVDFGLARIAGEATLTLANLPLGSPSYMAPELAAGVSPTVASDLYALGASLYHALALRPPFTGDPATVLARVRHDDPVPIQRAARDVPRDLAVVCMKAMAREPADRYRDVAAFAADLEAFADGRPVEARPLAPPLRLWRWTCRHPARTAAIVFALLLAPAAAIAGTALVHASERNARAAANAARLKVPALATIEGRNPKENLWPTKRTDAAARQALDAVLAADRRDEEALAMRAMLHFDEDRRSEALADLRGLAGAKPDAVVLAPVIAALAAGDANAPWPLLATLPPPRTALDHFLLGYWSERAQRWDDAEKALTAALAIDKNHGPSGHLLPLVLISRKPPKPDDAIDAASGFEKQFGGATARTLHVRGYAHVRKRQWREAIADFEASIALCTTPSAGTLRNLAIVHRSLGDGDAALVLLERARALVPGARGVLLECFGLSLATGNRDGAIAVMKSIPEDTETQLATRNWLRGRLSLWDAREAYEHGEDVEPMRSEAEQALTRARDEVAGEHRQRIEVDLVSTAFLRDRDHQRAHDELLRLDVGERNSADLMREAFYHAEALVAGGTTTLRSVARDHLERANLLEPGHRATAKRLAAALLADDPPRPLVALRVLVDAHANASAWRSAVEPVTAALRGWSTDAAREDALPLLAAAAQDGLFDVLEPPACVLAALREVSQKPRSLPPSLTALLSR